MKKVHGLLRFVAATLFWLNASVVFRPALAPVVAELADRFGVEFTSFSIILCLLSFSLLSLYGYKNAILSAIYIYTFPFILLWKVSRHLLRLIYWIHKGVRTAAPGPADDVPFSEFKPLWQAIVARNVVVAGQAQTTPAATVSAASDSTNTTKKKNGLRLSLRISGIVLGRSTLLCGLLTAVSSVKSIIIAGLILTSLSVVRLNILLLTTVLDMKKITAYTNDNFVKWIDAVSVAAENQASKSQGQRNPTASLLLSKLLLNIVAKAREVPELLTVGGLLTYLVSYIWIATVFFCIYLGLAKLTLSPAYWPQWLDSFLFPILGGNIAHTILLKTIVGFQWFEIALLTYVLWKFVGSEVDRFRKSLRKFESVLDDRIAHLEANIAARGGSVNGTDTPVESSKAVQPRRRKNDPRLSKTVRRAQTPDESPNTTDVLLPPT